MMPVTTMVNHYCSRNDDCNTNSAVRAVLVTLEDLVGSSCYVNNKNIDKVSQGQGLRSRSKK